MVWLMVAMMVLMMVQLKEIRTAWKMEMKKVLMKVDWMAVMMGIMTVHQRATQMESLTVYPMVMVMVQ